VCWSIDRNINNDLGKRYVDVEGVDCVYLARAKGLAGS